MKNTLKLRKCAYIFDKTAERIFYTTEKERRAEVQDFLKKFYNDKATREKELSYKKENNVYKILIGNEWHNLKDCQILAVNDSDDVINNIKKVSADLITDEYKTGFKIRCGSDLESKKLSSFYCEFFMDDDDIGYIRLNFKYGSYRFIITKDNRLFDADCLNYKYKEITEKDIRKSLGIYSVQARKDFDELMQGIKSI